MLFYSAVPCAQTTTTLDAASTTTAMPLVNSVKFNADRAMSDLVKQVDNGPRLPASPGQAFTRKLIEDTLRENQLDVGKQDFTAKSPQLGYQVDGQNLFGVFPKGSAVKYVLSAHYDTRPFSDQDADITKWEQPVPGANDGASGVAVLLELARCIPKSQLGHGVALVFFDLEDHGIAATENTFCLGSQEFARNLPTQLKGYQYGINLDMIGDADLALPMEGWSMSKAPKLTFDLWRHGNALYPNVWKLVKGPSVYDDHMPFLATGAQYIDVIDINYPYWHTTQDTPDKCSAKSLEIIGDTILSFIKN